MPSRPRLAHLPIGLVLVVSGVAYAAGLGNPFFGSDTWPWLVSTRVANAGDVVRVAFSPIMSGTRFVAEVALFYHPLTALTYSLDQALFELHPLGFYATNLAFHLAAVGGLYSLARGLGASWWAASAGALVLGLHPIAAATVPSLPRRQDLVVGALLLGSMSVLVRAGLGEPRIRWGALVSAMALFFVALGGKEIAYAGLAVVPFVVLDRWERSQRNFGRSVAVVLGFLVLETAAFAVRWRVLGGLGGYFGAPTVLGSSQGTLEYFVRPYVTDVLWPFQAVLPERLRDLLLLLALGALIAGLAIARSPGHRQLLAVIGVVWQAAFLGLYAVVHTSLSAYLLYVPLAGAGLLVAALLDGAADRLNQGMARGSWAWLSFGCAALSGAGALIFLAGLVQTSALLTDYPEFRDAASVSKQFVEQAIPCIAAAPSGSRVDVDGLPHRIDYPSASSQLIDAYVFEPYSLESVERLLAPDARAEVTVRSSQDVQHRPRSVAVTCTHPGDNWQIGVDVL